MSCGPRVGPTPNMSMTTGYSGSTEANDCISCLSAAQSDLCRACCATACNVTGDGALTLMLTGYAEKHGIADTGDLESPIL